MDALISDRFPLPRLHRALLWGAAALTLLVVGLGAFVRLSDAGLGCPDWPGCYGHWLGVPEHAHEIARATLAFPDQPVHAGKAWKEMLHRYAAGTLGLMVLGIAVSAWRLRRRVFSAENGLLLLIVVQAALGMWTVTLLLKPVIVTLHLLGGMATWAMLVHLLCRDGGSRASPTQPHHGSWWGIAALIAVFVQIGLGGWVSSNYAALACLDFPACRNGEFWPPTDFVHGFSFLRELGVTPSGDVLPFAALTAIHLTHRVGALVVVLLLGAYVMGLLQRPDAGRRFGLLLAGALILQVTLGVSNVVFSLPLPVAVLHNLGAAALLGLLVVCRAR